jgi:hypothetical protein
MVGTVAGTPGIATGSAGVDGGDVTLIAATGITVNQPISTVSGAGGLQLLGPAVITNSALVRGWGHILLNAGTVQRPAILVAPTGGVLVVHASASIPRVRTLSRCGIGLLEQTFRRFSIARIEGNTDAGLYRKNDSLERIVLGDLRRKLGVHSRSFAVSSSNGRLGKIAAETCRGGHRMDIMAGRP